MNALGASLLSTLALIVFLAPRRWALIAMVAGILYLPTGLYVDVGGFSLYPMRILEVVGLARALARREFPAKRLNRLDGLLLLLYAFSVSVFLLRSSEGFAYQIGAGVDALFLYAVFRSLIRDLEDLKWILRGTVVLLLPYVPLVWFETLTFRNPFAAIGGVENIRAGELWMREGRLRATGSFGHPSLLGTFGGAFLPLFVGLWFAERSGRIWAVLGIALCLGIVGAANSGGPAICVAAAALGWALWPIRRNMRLVRASLVAALVMLSLVMKAPIWYVLARISDVTGGDGYHRAVLLEIGFRNLDRWWLAGMPFRETASWLPYTNTSTGAVDMTNNFLLSGVTAGLGAVILLIAMLAVAFSRLGRTMSSLRAGASPARSGEPLLWGLGVALSVHIFNWFGITYWDQTNAMWFLHLAMIGSLTFAAAARLRRPSGQDDASPTSARLDGRDSRSDPLRPARHALAMGDPVEPKARKPTGPTTAMRWTRN